MIVNYIFRLVDTTDDTVKKIKKTLRKQAKFNRILTIFALTVNTYAIVSEINNYEQNKKIEKIFKEIEELRRMKGE